MPLDNIERAIKKGSGELGGAALVELTMEGYGPGGVAVMIEATTDNRNRTVSDIRSTLTKHGGNLGESGSVSWLFESKGVIVAEITSKNKDDIELLAIDAGAEDVKEGDDYLEIYTSPQQMEEVRKALESKTSVTSSEVQLIPKTMATPDEKGYFSTLKLIDHLEELDDVQHVYANVDFPPEILEKYESGNY
jgi:YebC/PmpR family DNA-binding regulatory protein